MSYQHLFFKSKGLKKRFKFTIETTHCFIFYEAGKLETKTN